MTAKLGFTEYFQASLVSSDQELTNGDNQLSELKTLTGQTRVLAPKPYTGPVRVSAQIPEPKESFAGSVPAAPALIEPNLAKSSVNRKQIVESLPITSPLKSFSETKLSELPDATFRLLASYNQRREEFPIDNIDPKKTTIIVPAYNEEVHITKTLESLRKNGGNNDVIVSLNNTKDNSAKVITEWAAAHPDVELTPITENTGELPPVPEGKQRFLLLDSPIPGKAGALMRPLEFLQRQPSMPGKIFTIDADSILGDGQLAKLEEKADRENLYAVSGKIKFTVPDGENLSVLNQVTNRVHGEEGFQTLCGAFTLYDTVDFFTGYQAIQETVPGVRAEDGVFGHLLPSSGRPVGVDTQVPFESLGAWTKEQANSQRSRWVSAGAQVEKLFKPVMDKIGTGGQDNVLHMMSTQVKSIWRDNTLGSAVVQTLCLPLQLSEGIASLMDWSKGENSSLDKAYHWEPPR